MKLTRLLRSILPALAVLGLGIPAAATASTPSQLDGLAITVSYADLNIASEAGARVLYARLQRASREACDVRSLTVAGSVRRVTQTQACYREALSAAVEEIDSEALTKIHAG